jgi:O-antigen/teichoic acid export membrane protein
MSISSERCVKDDMRIPPPGTPRKAVPELLWTILAQVGGPLASVVTLKLLTVYLNPGNYGVIAVVLTYSFAAGSVLVAPMSGPGAVYYHQWAQQGQERQFLASLLGVYGSVCGFLIVVHFAAAFFGHLKLESLLGIVVVLGGVFLSLEILKTAVITLTNVARCRRRYAFLSIVDGWGRLLIAVLLIFLLGKSSRSVLVAYSLNSATVAFLGWYAFLRPVDKNYTSPPVLISRSLVSLLVKSSWAYCGIGLANWVISLSDRTLLAAMVSLHDAGIYAAGYQAASLFPLAVYSTAGIYMFPLIYERNARSFQEAAAITGSCIGYLTWLTVPVTLIAVLGRRTLLSLLLGQGYDAGTSVVLWVAPALALNTLTSITAMPFWLRQQGTRYLALVVAAAVCNISLNFLLIPRIGFTGAAVSTLVTYLFLFVSSVAVGRRLMRWTIPTPHSCAILAGIVVAGIAYMASGFVGPLVQLFVFMIVYFLCSTLVLLVYEPAFVKLAKEVAGYTVSWMKSTSLDSRFPAVPPVQVECSTAASQVSSPYTVERCNPE